MKDTMQFFRNYFRDHNIRYTETRALIMDWIVNHGEHFTAEDIQRWALLKDLKIGRATIYRTLSLLVKNNFIVRRDFTKNHSHYELIFNNEPHEHMICIRCNQIFEFKNKKIEKLLREEAGAVGFIPTFHNIKIYGECLPCREKGKR